MPRLQNCRLEKAQTILEAASEICYSISDAMRADEQVSLQSYDYFEDISMEEVHITSSEDPMQSSNTSLHKGDHDAR